MGKITPGERMHNWASAFMQLWPAWVFVLGLLGYSNKDEIGGFIFAGDKAITNLTPFEAYVRDEIERIDTEEAIGRAEIAQKLEDIEATLKKQDRVNYKSLVKQLDSQQESIEIIEGLVN